MGGLSARITDNEFAETLPTPTPPRHALRAREEGRRSRHTQRLFTPRHPASSANPWRDRRVAGRGNAVNGNGRVTSIAANPNRAVSKPFSTPSPSRCESFAAMPWPSTCWIMLSLAAMPPVMARWLMAWRIRRDHAERARPAAIETCELAHQPDRGGERRTAHPSSARGLIAGDHRDALRGRPTQGGVPPRSSGDINSRSASLIMIGAIDDLAGMGLHHDVRARASASFGLVMGELQQIRRRTARLSVRSSLTHHLGQRAGM